MVSKISGIYAYYDNLRCEIIYVGRDSHIDENRRHRAHYSPSLKDSQKINKILQNNNSGRYNYVVLEQGDFTDDELNQKEISWISFFNPRFNFTPGGDGAGSGENHHMYGKHHTEEAREKMSLAMSGKNHHMYGKHHTEEAREKMSRAKKGKKHSEETRKKMREAKFDPCIKIRKQESKRYTQGFFWRAYPSTPKKTIYISSVDLEKCIEKVEDFLKSEKNVYGYESYEVVDE